MSSVTSKVDGVNMNYYSNVSRKRKKTPPTLTSVGDRESGFFFTISTLLAFLSKHELHLKLFAKLAFAIY